MKDERRRRKIAGTASSVHADDNLPADSITSQNQLLQNVSLDYLSNSNDNDSSHGDTPSVVLENSHNCDTFLIFDDSTTSVVDKVGSIL